MTGARLLIIAHRGASAERPEHTLEAYDLAIAQGADVIEPDLVMTRDGVLVARHENEISGTTDVAQRPEFAARRTRRSVDGRAVTGWFTEDFTLAELRTLRARERLPDLRPGNGAHDGRFLIPTFAEIIALAHRRSAETKRAIGLYPELKHPSHFRALGLPMEKALLDELRRHSLDERTAPVFIQCFEVGALERLRGLTSAHLVQLLDTRVGPADRPGLTYQAMATRTGLAAVSAYADGVGPAKALLIPRDGAGRSLPPTCFVEDAKAAGLLVHPWTFRPENAFLPAELRRGEDPRGHGDMAAEALMFLDLGIDGVFTDAPSLLATGASSTGT
jgi:glycerophosphoryl diester phosphodiesterase